MCAGVVPPSNHGQVSPSSVARVYRTSRQSATASAHARCASVCGCTRGTPTAVAAAAAAAAYSAVSLRSGVHIPSCAIAVNVRATSRRWHGRAFAWRSAAATSDLSVCSEGR